MATLFPGSNDTFNEPSNPTDTPLGEAGGSGRKHAANHRDLGAAIEAMQQNSALKGHDHSGSDQLVHTDKLAQSSTHQSVDTNSSASAIHHTLGTTSTTAAAGNHVHPDIDPFGTFAINDVAPYVDGAMASAHYSFGGAYSGTPTLAGKTATVTNTTGGHAYITFSTVVETNAQHQLSFDYTPTGALGYTYIHWGIGDAVGNTAAHNWQKSTAGNKRRISLSFNAGKVPAKGFTKVTFRIFVVSSAATSHKIENVSVTRQDDVLATSPVSVFQVAGGQSGNETSLSTFTYTALDDQSYVGPILPVAGSKRMLVAESGFYSVSSIIWYTGTVGGDIARMFSFHVFPNATNLGANSIRSWGFASDQEDRMILSLPGIYLNKGEGLGISAISTAGFSLSTGVSLNIRCLYKTG